MKRQTAQIIDSVSSNQLLKALHTLQSLTNGVIQPEISFCNQDTVRPQNYIKHYRNKQFKQTDIVMSVGVMSSNSKNKYIKKNPSPLKQHHCNAETRSSNIKNRSCLSYEKTAQKQTSRVSHYSKVRTLKNQNRNHKQNQVKCKIKQSLYPSTYQTKKILHQKQKQGAGYIPIQQRTEQLLKEKEKKLAKLKKEKQLSKILEQKQYTFKPQIKPYKFSKNAERDDQSQHISDFEKQRFQECFINEEFIGPQIENSNNEISFLHETLQSNILVCQHEQTQPKIQPKRYKNEKFNFLLDLIQ